MRTFVVGLLGSLLPLSFAAAQETKQVPPGAAVTISVSPAAAAAPSVSITLHDRHGHVTPCKGCLNHTGGGNIDVQSPSSDTIVITMTGVCVADSSMDFDLDQCFEVTYDNPKVKKAKLTIDGSVIGLLRGQKNANAQYTDAMASITAGAVEVINFTVPPHEVCNKCQNLSVNDHAGPRTVPITAGKYSLNQRFHIAACGGNFLCHKASAEFAPDGALDPLWISYYEPFHGASKSNFGYQVTIKVAEDTDEAPANGKPLEEVAPPKK